MTKRMSRARCACIFAVVLQAALPALAQSRAREGQLLAVLEFRSKLDAAGTKAMDIPYLTDQVRAAAFRALPQLRVITRGDLQMLLDQTGKTLEQCEGQCAAQTGRNVGADLVIDGTVLSRSGFLVLTMELHETKLGELLGQANARGRTIELLDDALPDAMGTLFERLKGPTTDRSRISVVDKQTLGEVPALSGALKGGDAINTDIDEDLVGLYDVAVKSDRAAREHPAETALAWQKLADAVPKSGNNPYQDDASRRAKQWRDYSLEQKKLAEQRERDRSKLRKLLPLEVVNDGLKENLLLRYSRLYGGDEVAQLLALIPSPDSRTRAKAAVDCELGRGAGPCLQAAELHEGATDIVGAVYFHEKGCTLGSATACERLGELLLAGKGIPADPARAQLALTQACDKRSASACRALGQLVAKGELGKVEPSRVMDLYGKACDLKDGAACALAGALAQEAQPGDPTAGLSWQRHACDFGHQPSCEQVRAYEQQLAADRAERDRQDDERRAEETRLANAAAAERARLEIIAYDQRKAREDEASSIRTRRHVGYGAAVVGVLGLAGSGFFLMKGASNNDAIKNSPAKTGAEAQSILDQGKTYNTVALASGIAGLVGAAVAVPLILFNRESKEPTLAVAAAPSGVLISWRWP